MGILCLSAVHFYVKNRPTLEKACQCAIAKAGIPFALLIE
ncbi:Uncharacterised protein [Klebsiella variicola]|nr:Uncharacterised protein [Klebsiella variicola]SLU58660.1 Uncharacterised protein [Klebsiella variicola]SLY87943.1 Uncharacterised protein [Klebsiella variicola]SLZ14227.1 Uncharacterised protein [Klebsiella variicola]